MPNDRPAVVLVCIPMAPEHDTQGPVVDQAIREAQAIAEAAGCTGRAPFTTLQQLEDDDLERIQAHGLDPNASWLILTGEVR